MEISAGAKFSWAVMLRSGKWSFAEYQQFLAPQVAAFPNLISHLFQNFFARESFTTDQVPGLLKWKLSKAVDWLHSYQASGYTALISSHDPLNLDAKICDMLGFDLYSWFYGGKINGDIDDRPTE